MLGERYEMHLHQNNFLPNPIDLGIDEKGMASPPHRSWSAKINPLTLTPEQIFDAWVSDVEAT
jgi:hypothetical protein